MKNTVEKRNKGAPDESDPWESRELGADEKFVRVSSKETEDRIDAGLDLHMVSMRLPKDAVLELKSLAREQGLGYQPFVRQILMNYLKEHPRKKHASR